MTSRRDFLLALGASALIPAISSACSPSSGEAADASDATGLQGVGVQLYMLRAEMRADPAATLKRIADLGYEEIEWWGEWSVSPTDLRTMLDSHGLRSPAAHIDPAALAPDRLPALLDYAGTMGHRSLLVAWTPPDQRKSADDWKRVAATLNEAGAAAASSGVRTGYHNHDFEFTKFGDRTGFEILVTETDPRYVDIELDCFWAFKAGHDPLTLLRAHADRIQYLHLKDSSGAPEHAQRDIGSGVIAWKPLLEFALSQRVTSVFVERDDPEDPWESAQAGRAYMRTLGY